MQRKILGRAPVLNPRAIDMSGVMAHQFKLKHGQEIEGYEYNGECTLASHK
jgi:hypothetical protein